MKGRREPTHLLKEDEFSEDQWEPSLLDADWEASIQLIVDELETEELKQMANIVRGH